MADSGSNLALIGVAFLLGVAIGYMIRESRRNYITEFTRDATGHIVSIMERQFE